MSNKELEPIRHIEVTDQMVEAGLEVLLASGRLWNDHLVAGDRLLVQSIYHEMAQRRPQCERKGWAKSAQPGSADKAELGAPPDWDRMGQIADRLLSTPPSHSAQDAHQPKAKRPGPKLG